MDSEILWGILKFPQSEFQKGPVWKLGYICPSQHLISSGKGVKSLSSQMQTWKVKKFLSEHSQRQTDGQMALTPSHQLLKGV